MRLLLRRRMRLGLWLIVAFNLIFAITDLRLPAAVRWQIYAVKALEIGIAFAALALLPRCRTRWQDFVLGAAGASAICLLTAISGGIVGDVATTTILSIALVWGTAVLLPWPAAPQLAVAVVAGVGVIIDVLMVEGDLALAYGVPAVAVALALGVSVFVAREFERGRVTVREENAERSLAERALRRAHDELDERVRLRTADFEAANRRLVKAGRALGASEQRFRIASGLTSDYAYALRVQPGGSDVTEWLAADAFVTEWLTEDSFTRVTGYSAAEVAALGGGNALVHPDDVPIIEARRQALAAGRPDVSEFRILAKDGSIRWIRDHAVPEMDESSGALVRMYGAAQDITQRRATDRAIAEQERFVSAVLDTVGTVVGVVDRRGRIVRINRVCERTFGYRAEDVCGRHFWDLLPLEHEVEGAKAVFERLLAGDWPTTYDAYWLTPEGERICLALSTTFLRDERGEIEYVIGTGLDITERQRAAESLRASEERYRDLVDNANDLIYVHDLHGRFLSVNRAAQRVTGYSLDEALEMTVADIVAPDGLSRVSDMIATAARERETQGVIELHVVTRDGRTALLEVSPRLVERDGQPVAIEGIARDVTERNRAQQRIATLLELGDLIAGIRDRDALLDRVQRKTAEALPCDIVVTFYADGAGGGHRLLAQYGLPDPFGDAAVGLTFPPGEPFAGRVRRGETVVVNDMREQSWFPPEICSLLGIASLLAVPLRVGSSNVGTLVALRTSTALPFEEDQVELCVGIARQLAVALEAIELNRAQQMEGAISAALADVGRELIASVNTPALLERLCEVTARSLGCDFSHAYVWQAEENAFVPMAAYGDSPEQWESLRLLRLRPDDAGDLHARLVRDGIACVGPHGSGDPRVSALQARLGVTAALYLTLRRGEETVALLDAGFRRRAESFTLEQRRIARGIASIAALALQNARLFEELTRANALKSDFMAGMSHELRTPLNILIGYGDLLLDGSFGDLGREQSATLRRMQQTSCELLALIENTLDVSRLEAGRSPLVLADVVVAELIAQVRRETQPLWERPGLEFRTQVAPGLPDLHTDPVKLKVVLTNLVSNAIKFTEKGSIVVAAEGMDEGVLLSVADTGSGIAPHNLERIFEQFARGDHGGRGVDGLGLGLYIVRRLVALLHGTVTVESEIGRGSTFRVFLPRQLEDGTQAPVWPPPAPSRPRRRRTSSKNAAAPASAS